MKTLRRLSAQAVAIILLCGIAAGDPPSRGRDFDIPAADRIWLRSHGPVRVGTNDTSWPPYDIISEDGEHRGITADYLDLLSARGGFPIERVRFKTFPEAFEALQRGQIDMVGSMARTPAREKVVRFTVPYATTPSVIITRRDSSVRSLADLAGKKVALERGYAAVEFTRRAQPAAEIVEVTSSLEALQAALRLRRALRAHVLADERHLALDELLLLLVLAELGLVAQIALLLERGVVALETAQGPARELEDALAHAVEEPPVVRDHDHGGGAVLQELLEPFDGFGVEDCVYINGDFIETEVEWLNEGTDVSSLAGKPVQLVIRSRGTKLFSLQFVSR